MEVGVVGVKGERAIDQDHRLIVTPRLAGDDAEQMQRIGMFGMHSEDRLVARAGILRAAIAMGGAELLGQLGTRCRLWRGRCFTALAACHALSGRRRGKSA